MNIKLAGILLISSLLIACGSTSETVEKTTVQKPSVVTEDKTPGKEDTDIVKEEEKPVELSTIEINDQAKKLAKAEDYVGLEKFIEENATSISEKNLNAARSYISFTKSDEPISLRAAKLMDSVDYGYFGLLEYEIEQAIYSPQEEGSLIYDTYKESMGRSSYDNLDWQYNTAKGAYEEAKRYKDLVLKEEIEKEVKKDLIEEARGQNPHLGMSIEEVEASLWGKPIKINRTVTQYSNREQWVYGNGQYLYFTDGVLTSFQD